MTRMKLSPLREEEQGIALILAPGLTCMRGSGNFLKAAMTFDS